MFKRIKNGIKQYKEQIDTINKIKKGTLIICPYCKSLCVSHGKSSKKTTDYTICSGIQETYDVECEHCHRVGTITENWFELTKKEYEEIDKKIDEEFEEMKDKNKKPTLTVIK